MPAAGGEATQVTRGGGHAPFASPDDRFVYYTKGPGVDVVWRISVEGGEETQVLEAAVEWSHWVVAERGIYYITRPQADAPLYELEFFDFATSRTSRLATIEGTNRAFLVTGLAVSPDERWLLFTQRDTLAADLMLVENFR